MSEGQDVPRLIAALRAFADGLEGVFPWDHDTPQVVSSHLEQLSALLSEDAKANDWWRSLTAEQRVVLWERNAE